MTTEEKFKIKARLRGVEIALLMLPILALVAILCVFMVELLRWWWNL